jgi:Domain of unknown function (DUF6265)
MRTLTRCVITLLMTFAAGAASAVTVADFSWLSGCWASDPGEEGSGELWTRAAGGTLFGVSRTVKNGKTVGHEFMQIREVEPGQLAFIARPSGQAEATFKLVRSTGNELVFENPAHDFPQRVIYRLDSADRLVGRVEGKNNGREQAFDYPMKRTSCPGS